MVITKIKFLIIAILVSIISVVTIGLFFVLFSFKELAPWLFSLLLLGNLNYIWIKYIYQIKLDKINKRKEYPKYYTHPFLKFINFVAFTLGYVLAAGALIGGLFYMPESDLILSEKIAWSMILILTSILLFIFAWVSQKGSQTKGRIFKAER
jgi:hypothetical protein